MFPIGQQVRQNFDFGIVRCADKGSIIGVRRYIADIAPVRLRGDGINHAHNVGTGDLEPLPPLDAVSDDKNSYGHSVAVLIQL